MKMKKHKTDNIINFISDNSNRNSISAIISKFEAKGHPIRSKNHIKNKLFTLKMSGTETLQCDEVFYDSLLSTTNGNKNNQSEIESNINDSDVKTFKKRTIPTRGVRNLLSWFVFLLSSVNGAIVTTLTFILLLPRAFIKSLFYPGYRLLFGTLYPAYASYKAVRTRNVKEYVSNFRIFCYCN